MLSPSKGVSRIHALLGILFTVLDASSQVVGSAGVIDDLPKQLFS